MYSISSAVSALRSVQFIASYFYWRIHKWFFFFRVRIYIYIWLFTCYVSRREIVFNGICFGSSETRIILAAVFSASTVIVGNVYDQKVLSVGKVQYTTANKQRAGSDELRRNANTLSKGLKKFRLQSKSRNSR